MEFDKTKVLGGVLAHAIERTHGSEDAVYYLATLAARSGSQKLLEQAYRAARRLPAKRWTAIECLFVEGSAILEGVMNGGPEALAELEVKVAWRMDASHVLAHKIEALAHANKK
jgi:hypothetical protein